MFGAEALAYTSELDGIAVPPCSIPRQSYSAFQNHPSMPNHFEGQSMGTSLSHNHGFNRGEQSANDRSSTPDCAEFLREFFRDTPAKKIAKDAGINQRAAEAVKQGRNGLTMAHLENLCKSNSKFRVAWFRNRCGGILEGSPELVAAISMAINEIVRER